MPVALGINRRAPEHCLGFEDVLSIVEGAAVSLALVFDRRAPEHCLGFEDVLSIV